MFKLTRKQSVNLSRIASDDRTRPSLNGAMFTAKGAMTGKPALVATDGHRLAEIPVTVMDPEECPVGFGDADTDGAIIPRDVLAKSVPLHKRLVPMVAVNGKVTVWTPDGQASADCVEGPFPDYKFVVPGSEKVKAITTITLNASYLLELAKALSPDDPSTRVTLTFTGEDSAILVEPRDGGEARGLLMPLRKS